MWGRIQNARYQHEVLNLDIAAIHIEIDPRVYNLRMHDMLAGKGAPEDQRKFEERDDT